MGPGGGGQNQSDMTAGFFWTLMLIAIILLLIWYFNRQWFIGPVFWVRTIELDFLQFFVSIFAGTAHFLHIPLPSLSTLAKLKLLVAHANPKKVDFTEFSQINSIMGRWMRFPIGFVLLVMAVIVYFFHKAVHFKAKYSMDSLRKAEVSEWPQITPVVNLNLVKQDLNQGPWASSKTPMMVCQENNLIFPTVKDQYDVWGLRRGPAFRLFSLQLGRLYTGIDNLPIYAKALVVIFVARAERDRDVAKHFISQISGSASSGKLDFSGVEEQLVKYRDSKAISWVASRHAYVYTFMATLLEVSRSDGVLASAEFLWLKPVDRRMWYMLNHIGRQTSLIEISGAVAHWLAEKTLKRPLKTPMVKQAVDALEGALADILRVDKGEVWHSREA